MPYKLSMTIAVFLLSSTCAMGASHSGPKKVWGGGDKSTSTYSGKYVPHIIKVLEENRLAGYEWAGKSEGTVMNAEMVTANPTHLAVGQLDILRNIKGNPMANGNDNYAFTILHENIGPECLYAVTAQKGYTTWGHVLGNAWDLTIFTGGAKSGAYGTLQGLIQIYPDMADAKVVNAGGAMDIIDQVRRTPSSIGFFVMRPDPNSPVFMKIVDSKLSLVPVVDFELEGLYEFLDLKVAHGGLFSGGEFHTTACTSVALITGDLSQVDQSNTRDYKRLKATIDRVGGVSAEKMKPDLSSWRDMWDSMKSASKQKISDLGDASKEAFDSLKKKVQ